VTGLTGRLPYRYRIYFGRDGNRLIVLIGGGTKKGQNKDIRAAQRL
jgi:putative addiction module killer protein